MASGPAPAPTEQIDPVFVEYLVSGIQMAGGNVNPNVTVDQLVSMAGHVPGLLSAERYQLWRANVHVEQAQAKPEPFVVTVPTDDSYKTDLLTAVKTAHRVVNRIKVVRERDREEA